MTEENQKVKASHLSRNAYLYVRQSTLRQVFENTESTKRQYALRERAVSLGWPPERIIVIDNDLGQSGASATTREGFQRLVADVGLGNAGIVLGLEVSRLARNSSDWHRLLEICALTSTLILDEDGLYDPAHFNDRLLLGLKGTMSEAELHVLRARLRGGILNKARRGELQVQLPVGLVYAPDGKVALDPDKQVQECMRAFFQMFRRAGTAFGTVKEFHKQSLLFPRRLRKGPHQGQLAWGPLGLCRTLQVLHNPRYAGVYFFGRTRQQKKADGRSWQKRLPKDQWQVLLPQAHPGYISWEEYEENQHRLLECAQAHGIDRHDGPPREGPALLQGLAVCGKCGRRMTVRYHMRRGRLAPEYLCQREGIERGQPKCQTMQGPDIDDAIGKMLVETMTPAALELTLAVQQELQGRLDEANRLRKNQVERAQYEADLAQRRYMQVDPGNRLVAATLEAEWNERIRMLHDAQQEYECKRQTEPIAIDSAQHNDVLALAANFPALWNDPRTPQRDRKRMARLLIEDITLLKGREITVQVRFKAGATRSFTLPLPKNAWEERLTDPTVIADIDRLLDQHTHKEIAAILNQQGRSSGMGIPFTRSMVAWLCHTYNLKNRFYRLRARGLLTVTEMAARLDVTTQTIKIWRRHGLLRAHAANDRSEYLFEPPGVDAPVKSQGCKLSERPKVVENLIPEDAKEVQCEA